MSKNIEILGNPQNQKLIPLFLFNLQIYVKCVKIKVYLNVGYRLQSGNKKFY